MLGSSRLGDAQTLPYLFDVTLSCAEPGHEAESHRVPEYLEDLCSVSIVPFTIKSHENTLSPDRPAYHTYKMINSESQHNLFGVVSSDDLFSGRFDPSPHSLSHSGQNSQTLVDRPHILPDLRQVERKGYGPGQTGKTPEEEGLPCSDTARQGPGQEAPEGDDPVVTGALNWLFFRRLKIVSSSA